MSPQHERRIKSPPKHEFMSPQNHSYHLSYLVHYKLEYINEFRVQEKAQTLKLLHVLIEFKEKEVIIVLKEVLEQAQNHQEAFLHRKDKEKLPLVCKETQELQLFPYLKSKKQH